MLGPCSRKHGTDRLGFRRIDRICKVEQEAGWKGPGHERFSNKDLDPVPREKRTWGLLSTVSYVRHLSLR